MHRHHHHHHQQQQQLHSKGVILTGQTLLRLSNSPILTHLFTLKRERVLRFRLMNKSTCSQSCLHNRLSSRQEVCTQNMATPITDAA